MEEKWPRKCKIKRCLNDAKVGAHIQIRNWFGRVFIFPMCHRCNARRDKKNIWMSIKKKSYAVVEPFVNFRARRFPT